MSNYFTLVFGTSLGKTKSFRVTNPNTNLTDEAISSAMSTIQTSDVFDQANGSLISKRSAELVSVNSRTFVLE